jgi:hypothetical protein
MNTTRKPAEPEPEEPEIRIVGDGTDIYVTVDGVKIARRGSPGTPQAKIWVSLEPGWSVIDQKFLEGIVIEYNEVRVH